MVDHAYMAQSAFSSLIFSKLVLKIFLDQINEAKRTQFNFLGTSQNLETFFEIHFSIFK